LTCSLFRDIVLTMEAKNKTCFQLLPIGDFYVCQVPGDKIKQQRMVTSGNRNTCFGHYMKIEIPIEGILAYRFIYF
jgi:hypothetical protein